MVFGISSGYLLEVLGLLIDVNVFLPIGEFFKYLNLNVFYSSTVLNSVRRNPESLPV